MSKIIIELYGNDFDFKKKVLKSICLLDNCYIKKIRFNKFEIGIMNCEQSNS